LRQQRTVDQVVAGGDKDDVCLDGFEQALQTPGAMKTSEAGTDDQDTWT
jgi:hypothetical protein